MRARLSRLIQGDHILHGTGAYGVSTHNRGPRRKSDRYKLINKGLVWDVFKFVISATPTI